MNGGTITSFNSALRVSNGGTINATNVNATATGANAIGVNANNGTINLTSGSGSPLWLEPEIPVSMRQAAATSPRPA